MQAALDGFCEFFKCDDPHVEETAPLRPSDSVDFAALTVQFARNKSSSGRRCMTAWPYDPRLALYI